MPDTGAEMRRCGVVDFSVTCGKGRGEDRQLARGMGSIHER